MQPSTLERRVMTKVAWRLLPFMGICYLAAFLDRVNVGFAKLSMAADLNFSTVVYATGAGIFFDGASGLGANAWLENVTVVASTLTRGGSIYRVHAEAALSA